MSAILMKLQLMQHQSNPPGIERNPVFVLPFSREQLRTDIMNIILFEMRRFRHMTKYNAKLLGLGSDNEVAFWDAGMNPQELGMKYKDVESFTLALVLEDHFDYAFFAATSDRCSQPFEADSIHTYVAAYLEDLSNSRQVQEWEAEGHESLHSGIRRCLHATEITNARRILEGFEPFFYFNSVGAAKDEADGNDGELSIRQLAMLSGMEEMSLRSAISRKTPPVLEIQKDARRTYVSAEVARQWPTAKGRYLPILRARTSAAINLSTTRFEKVMLLTSMLQDRCHYIATKAPDSAEFEKHLATALTPYGAMHIDELGHDALANKELMAKLAELLDLPADLLVMRAKEAVLRTEIWMREYELKLLLAQA